ncbi:Y-family DNA polymerase [Enterococcus raffinosus]|uniref:Y-family DNA polymerase n=1 Tax=Enterococcus raffinosus TaxID=71452 RepID=UPI003AC85D56
MDWNDNPKFDYEREPSRDILCIDCKSFYASVECVERGLNPLTAKLVVMSYPSDNPEERGSGLILASSPAAKAAYGISNVSRARDLPFPYPADLILAAPRMGVYMQKNMQINNIYRKYADEDNHSVFSVDESFLDVTDSLKLYGCETADQLAKIIQTDVYRSTGIYTTCGIGENPFLAKVALDLYSKHNRNMRAEIRYEDVPEKLWSVTDLTEICGIGKRTKKRLERMNIRTMYDLAHADYWRLKTNMGIIGTELFAKAWGIDRSFLGQKYTPASKSIGNSQVLNRDYTRREDIEVVIKEMADQVATRLRRAGAKTACISLWVGFSMGYIDRQDPDKQGFHQQMRISLTNSSKEIAETLLIIFDRHYRRQDIRTIGVNCSKLTYTNTLQLNLFQEPEEQINNYKVDFIVDVIRKKFGFKSIVHAHSLLAGGRAIDRSSLIGGHAGGMSGIEGDPHGQAN